MHHNKHLVFVYGTLKRGLNNSHLLENAEFIGDAFTVDAFRMFSVGFPVVQFNDDGDPVSGEVYEVDDETLARLDRLESVGHMYDRHKITVAYVNDFVKDAFLDADVNIYVGNKEYWARNSHAPYTTKNEHGELCWQP